MSRQGPTLRLLVVCDGCDWHQTLSDDWFQPMARCTLVGGSARYAPAHNVAPLPECPHGAKARELAAVLRDEIERNMPATEGT